LVDEGGVRDIDVLVAAILHDTVEDTETTNEEICGMFGDVAGALVAEVTDDRSLSRDERKAWQVEHAPHLSRGAMLIKIADKMSNVRDMYASPPQWTLKRRSEYLDWAVRVVNGMRGVHVELEALFDNILAKARAVIRTEEELEALSIDS